MDRTSTPLWFALMTTAFVANGIYAQLLSRWAGPAFARSFLLVVFLLPLLTASAVDAFVILLVQAITVTVGVGLLTRMCSRGNLIAAGPNGLTLGSHQPAERSVYRFSLAASWQFVSLVAVVLAACSALTETTTTERLVLVGMGIAVGVCSVCGKWLAFPSARGFWSWLAVLLVSLVIATSLVRFDGVLLPKIFEPDDWPLKLLPWYSLRSTCLWWLILPAVCYVSAIWFLLRESVARRVGETDNSPMTWRGAKRVRIVVKLLLASMTIAIVALPATVVVWLNWPSELPPPSEERRNNYRQVIEIARRIGKSPFASAIENWAETPENLLAAAVEPIADDLDRLRELIRQPAEVPIEWNSFSQFEWLSDLRQAARALALNGRLALAQNDPENAARSFLDCVRFGHFVRSRGSLVDGLVGVACSYAGLEQLYERRSSLSQDACLMAARELQQLLIEIEPVEDFIIRDRIWSWNLYSWIGRTQQLFAADESDWETSSNAFRRETAVMQLVATELALHAYHQEHGGWPERLDWLVPDYLPQAPIDPLDPNNHFLRYEVQGEQFRLFSVGLNGKSELGAGRSDEPSNSTTDPDDLLLSDFFGE